MSQPVPAARPTRTVVRRGVATLVGWYAATILAVVVLTLLLPTENADGTCEGIGFGCTPAPRDGMLIVAMYLGPPVLLVSLVIAVGTLAIAVRRFRSGVAAGTLAAFLGIPGGVVIVIGALWLFPALF